MVSFLYNLYILVTAVFKLFYTNCNHSKPWYYAFAMLNTFMFALNISQFYADSLIYNLYILDVTVLNLLYIIPHNSEPCYYAACVFNTLFS